MKVAATLICFFLLVNVAAQKLVVTASTPAGSEVRQFLGIGTTDSVDFIRWKITINNNRFLLHCNYGIGKPNTNGFINGGMVVNTAGEARFQFPYWHFYNGKRHIAAVALNKNLFHFLDAGNHPLAGNGGWSYTLNSTTVLPASSLSWKGASPVMGDSVEIERRTPCRVPVVEDFGSTCYKLKWHIIFYTEAGVNTRGRYNIPTVPYHKAGGRKGKWKMIKDMAGNTIYQLYDKNDQVFLRLVPIDNTIFLFADEQGNLLVGNEDFSYTLNKKGYQ